MPAITVGHYTNPEEIGFKGWVEAKEWIVFIDNDNKLMAYTRNLETGAVIGDAIVST